jgi:hypothetical protein
MLIMVDTNFELTQSIRRLATTNVKAGQMQPEFLVIRVFLKNGHNFVD